MKITKQHLDTLGSLIRDVDERNTLGCDGCFELMSQYADAMVEGIELDDAMQGSKSIYRNALAVAMNTKRCKPR